MITLRCTVNGRPVTAEIEARRLLLDFLREDLALTGAKRSCEVQVCGACTVLVDGAPVSACCFLACDAEGREILTIEGFTTDPLFETIERAFVEHAAVQCGFCIPGVVLTIKSLADDGELTDDEADLRHALDGNICRCTGYRSILDAARDVARAVAS